MPTEQIVIANRNGYEVDKDALTRRALKHSVQQFAPPINAGAFLVSDMSRGPILPNYGSKERDRILRLFDQHEYNSLWQGAIAGLIKKIISTPWEIKGSDTPEGNYWANYYQAVFQYAHYGKGWGYFLSLVLRDFYTQDYGGFIEMIGPGDPQGSITGALGNPNRRFDDPIRYYGLAHKDTYRCYLTGNPTWPVVYFSLMTGKLHKMHHSRIRRLVDMPNPDERYFGIGLSSLSRCIAIANREIRMSQYVDGYLDDKPKPGLAITSGMTETQWKQVWKSYLRDQSSDALQVWGRTAVVHSLDMDHPADVKMIPFAQTPEKFDWIKYVDLDVNALALGIGIDRQEIWELAGRGIGSGAQSEILAAKAEGKAYGFILQELERLFNNDILPRGLEFRFKTKNTVADSAQADIDTKYANIAVQLSSVPDMTTGAELRSLLAAKSQTFADAFSNEQGSIDLIDSDIQEPDQEIILQDDAPPDTDQTKPIENAAAKPPAKPAATKGLPFIRWLKDFASDSQRRWFFANNPQFAAAGSMPHLLEGASREQHRQALEAFAETHKNHVTNHLWDSGMIEYNDKAQVVVNHDKTRSAAADLVKDARDASVPRSYLVSSFGEVEGHTGTTRQLESKLNAVYSSKAQATLLAAHVGGVKLTDAQHTRLTSLAQGNYLNDKYSQYASGDRGTLLGVAHERLRPMSAEAQAWRAERAADFRQNVRGSRRKDYQSTRDEFISSLVDLIQASDQQSRRRFGIIFRAQLRRLGQQAFKDGLEAGGVSDPLDDDDMAQVQHWLIGQSDYVSGFADEVYQKGLSPAEVYSRAEIWANKSIQTMFDAGRLSADRNGMYEFILGRTEKHCPDCLRLNGQRHRFKEWYGRNLIPRSQGVRTKCGGWRCDCRLVKTTEKARGRF